MDASGSRARAASPDVAALSSSHQLQLVVADRYSPPWTRTWRPSSLGAVAHVILADAAITAASGPARLHRAVGADPSASHTHTPARQQPRPWQSPGHVRRLHASAHPARHTHGPWVQLPLGPSTRGTPAEAVVAAESRQAFASAVFRARRAAASNAGEGAGALARVAVTRPARVAWHCPSKHWPFRLQSCGHVRMPQSSPR